MIRRARWMQEVNEQLDWRGDITPMLGDIGIPEDWREISPTGRIKLELA